MAESLQQLRDLLTPARWEAAAELLSQHGPDKAADAIVPLPFEQQRLLFRHLPTDFAAAIAGHFPYFHAYVLLYSLITPEGSWQSLIWNLQSDIWTTPWRFGS